MWSLGSLLTILSLGGLTITPPVNDSSPFMLIISSSLSAVTVSTCGKWNPWPLHYGGAKKSLCQRICSHNFPYKIQTLSALFFQTSFSFGVKLQISCFVQNYRSFWLFAVLFIILKTNGIFLLCVPVFKVWWAQSYQIPVGEQRFYLKTTNVFHLK